MNNWRENKIIVGLAAADAAINAIQQELVLHDKELTKEECRKLHADISLLVRQTVSSRFVPKTHMDI